MHWNITINTWIIENANKIKRILTKKLFFVWGNKSVVIRNLYINKLRFNFKMDCNLL